MENKKIKEILIGIADIKHNNGVELKGAKRVREYLEEQFKDILQGE